MAPGTLIYQNLITAYTAARLPQYDWYRWEPSAFGTFTANINVTQGQDVELHLFTLQGNTLIELSNNTAPGVLNKTLSNLVIPGQVMLVEIKGREVTPGVFTTARYDMTVSLTTGAASV
jgi:hypothetical protein